MVSYCSSPPLDSSVEVLEVSEKKKTLGTDDDSVIDLATSEEDEDSDSVLLQTSPRKDDDDENDDETLEDSCQGEAEEGETIEVTCLDDDYDSQYDLKVTKSNNFESIILELSDCEGDYLEHEVGKIIGNGEIVVCGGAVETYTECSGGNWQKSCKRNVECVETKGGSKWCFGPRTKDCYTFQ